jgi:hypothetical protein
MEFTLTTKKGTEIVISEGTEIVIEIDGIKYKISISKINN